MFQIATAFELSAVDVDALEEVAYGRDSRVERGAFQDALELRNGLVDHLLRDPEWPFCQLEVVQARRGRRQFGTDRLDLEGDPLGRTWPSIAKRTGRLRPQGEVLE